jgi:hypothetical protein
MTIPIHAICISSRSAFEAIEPPLFHRWFGSSIIVADESADVL